MSENMKELHEKGKESLINQAIQEDEYNEFRDSTEEDTESIKNPEDYNISFNPKEEDVDDLEKYDPTNYTDNEEEYPEVNEFDLPIFPGGPVQSQVDSWKQAYANCKIFIIELAEEMYIYRTLNRHEYKQIVEYDINQLTREEVICKTCTLWPIDFGYKQMANGKAGVPSTYASIIMESSGFTKQYKIVEL
jgi:hypothetical protein